MCAAWKRRIGILGALAAVSLATAGRPLPALSLQPHLNAPQIVEVRPQPPNSVNPLRATNATALWLDSLMFDTLTHLRHGQLTPDLASHWQEKQDGRIWDIHLNPRAKWWNGRPVSARDVAWSYQIKIKRFRAKNRDLAALRPKFSISGDLQLVVTLAKPDPRFLRQFGTQGPSAWVLPAFLLNKVKAKGLLTTPYLDNPVDMVGSGPYRLLQLSSKNARLVANMHYFGGVPKNRRILVRFSGKNAVGAGG